MELAGENAQELRTALKNVSPAHADGLRYLITHMPEADLKSLDADYLLENVKWAYEARENTRWGKDIPEELFLDAVLPYASINERRDNWRKDFYDRFMPLVKDCKTAGEAAQVLNRDIWKIVDVKYHASKRPKPDQSPYESMEAKFASCSGLSVLLVDACRAVCVPARFVGTPMWSDKRGNHSWVEVWDGIDWQFTGACEYNAKGLGKTWFAGKAAKASANQWEHAIYASTWKKGSVHFPLIWDLKNRSVNAVNVTDRYTGGEKKVAEHKVYINVFAINAVPIKGGARLSLDFEIHQAGKTVAKGRTKGDESDSNDMTAVALRPGEAYEFVVPSKGFRKTFSPSGKEDEAENFFLNGE